MIVQPAAWGRSGQRPRRVALAVWSALAILYGQPAALALSCIPPGPLLPLNPRETVVLGEVLSRREDGSVVIRVEEWLQRSGAPLGTAGGPSRSSATLRLDSRQLSYWTFGRLPFPRGSRWIFQLLPADGQAGRFDASLSPCIEPPQVLQGVVRGWLRNDSERTRPQTMTLAALRRLIRAGSRPLP
ncbi:MAG: hypothetical protein ACKO8I_10485 [Cyanobacteriota bacterium]